MALAMAEKLLKYPTAVGRLAIVLINNAYCIPTYVVWMTMLLPLKKINLQMYYKIEGLLFHWLLAIVTMWSYTAGYDIVEVGDDINICKDKRTLVMANHQSTADVPLLMANFNTKENVLPNLMWIMDRLFKYTNFGIVSIIHQDFFISAGRKNRDESINALRNHLKTSFLKLDRKWMVLFPEGGFLRKRRAVSQRFAEKNNLPLLEYVTLPRVGAFKAIMDVMCIKNDNININDDNNDNKNDNDNDNNIKKENNDVINVYKNESQQNNSTNSINTTKINSNENLKSKLKSKSKSNSSLNTNINANTKTKIKTTAIETETSTPTATAATTTTTTNEEEELNPLVKQLSNGNVTLANKIDELTSSISSDCLLEYVLDITIAYPNGIPLDLLNIVYGWRDPCKTHMLYRLYKVSEVPKDEQALTQWLYDRFIEKNDLLQNFYNHGKFYIDRSMSTNLIQQDVLRFVLINLFFITSTYLHYKLFCVIYTYCNILIYSIS